MENPTKVCVTGITGYLASSLVKRLLEKGYTVHGTMRNLGDTSKSSLLRSFPNAETLLKLFQADIYHPDEFEEAIQGCHYVIHLATPFHHDTTSVKFQSTSEAAVAGVRSIVRSCIKSGTVKRLIYTASVTAASPLKDDGTGFKDSMDENCWTPLNLSVDYSNDHLMAYTSSKTLSELEVLKHNNEIEVVSLACGLVGGETVLAQVPVSTHILISQLTRNRTYYESMRFLEELLGKVPVVHIDDVCEAHIFSIENESINGRFLCASDYISTEEIARYYQSKFPKMNLPEEFVEHLGRQVVWGSRKLNDIGFKYKYDAKLILDESLECAVRKGEFHLTSNNLE